MNLHDFYGVKNNAGESQFCMKHVHWEKYALHLLGKKIGSWQELAAKGIGGLKYEVVADFNTSMDFWSAKCQWALAVDPIIGCPICGSSACGAQLDADIRQERNHHL